MEKILKGKLQTTLFTGRALTSITCGKHTVNPAPQIPATPKNTLKNQERQSDQSRKLPLENPSPELAHLILKKVWNTTPVFHQTFYTPSASTPLQASDGRFLAFDAGETENKVQDRQRVPKTESSGCLLHYWPWPEQPFYSRTPQCAKTEHKIFHEAVWPQQHCMLPLLLQGTRSLSFTS